MATSTVENYIKQILLLQNQSDEKLVPLGRLSTVMGVVPGTATTMVKALTDAQLVHYEPRQGVRLTESGEKLALHVVRRHRLLELFLVKVLKLDWSEVHPEAEELEHAISDKVLEHIDALLGRPSVDPHGDPIPTARGQVQQSPMQSLADCPLGKSLRVARIIDQEPQFLQFVDRCGLTPGVWVSVESREEFAQAVCIRPQARNAITLGIPVAAKILVEPQAGREG